MSNKISFVSVGECMLEMAQTGEQQYQLGFAGDTLTVAVYLARCSDLQRVRVDYATALGDDAHSAQMLAQWRDEGVGTDSVRIINGALPGLYLIETDEMGERSFHYYRSQAAAKQMFQGSDGKALAQSLLDYDYLYLSGITLAILDEQSQDLLIETLAQAHAAGRKVCFDSNYRPKLWASKPVAQAVIKRVLPYVSIALPSFDDEHDLMGDTEMSECAERMLATGVSEVVVKRGGDGCLIATENDDHFVPINKVENVVDTTAAGDSFNGAYLAGRVAGKDPVEAAQAAMQVSAVVIQHRGAIIDKKFMP